MVLEIFLKCHSMLFFSTGEFSSPSSARVVLIERCYSSSDWEEAPEDVGLAFSQLSALRIAVAAVCGVQGILDVGVQLVRLVSVSIGRGGGLLHAGSDHADSTVQSERGRGVDSMVCYHAERCATSLLLLSSSERGSGGGMGPSLSRSRDEEESLVVSLLLQTGTKAAEGGREHIEQHNGCEVKAHRFMWRVFQVCCTSFSVPSVICSLDKIRTHDAVSVQVHTLRVLLTGAAANWHKGREGQCSTLLLLSWCISAAQFHTNDVPTLTSLSLSANSSNPIEVDRAVDSKDISDRIPLFAALSSLSTTERKSLSLAVELSSSQLSDKDRLILSRILLS